VKRIFRIYPPLAFAIILSSALFLLIQPHSIPQLTDWFNKGSWTDRPNPALVGGHLAMLGTSNYESLDNAIWSLVHEMRISLVFPLIAYFVARNAKLSILFSLIVSGAALFAAHHLGSFAADWALTAHYAVLFFWGAAIAQNRVRLAQWLNARSPCAKLLLWVIVFACLFMPPEFLNGWMVYVVAVGAAGIVALCPLDSRAVNVLEAKFPLYLGKISYSLYLVHLPILLAVTHLFYDRVPTWVLVTVGTLLIFIVADLTNRWVERPSQAFGRFLVGRRHSIRYSRNCN
jgi:peptidoglycan/LPS O-acetylase OafA/YrhL